MFSVSPDSCLWQYLVPDIKEEGEQNQSKSTLFDFLQPNTVLD